MENTGRDPRASLIRKYSFLYSCLAWVLLVSYSQHISWNPFLVLLSPLALVPAKFLWSIQQAVSLPMAVLTGGFVLEGLLLFCVLRHAWRSTDAKAQVRLWIVTLGFGLMLFWVGQIGGGDLGSWIEGLVGSWTPAFPIWRTLLVLGLSVLGMAAASFYRVRTNQMSQAGFVTYLVCCLIVVGMVWHLRKPRIEFMDYYHEGLAKARIFGLWGYVDHSLRVVIPPRFDFAKPFTDGLAPVHIWSISGYPRGWCYVDKSGRVALKMPEGGAGSFHEGLAFFCVDSKYGFIDKTGAVVIPPHFDHVDGFSDGLAVVKIGSKYGFIDRTGAVVIPPNFDHVNGFSDGLAALKVNSKYGFIDKTGALVIAPQFDQVGKFSEGLARVLVAGEWGYIGHDGQSVIAGPFKEAEDFSEGLAVVRLEGKAGEAAKQGFGYINRYGRVVIPAEFDRADSFSGGFAEVWQNRRRLAIDKSGKPVSQ